MGCLILPVIKQNSLMTGHPNYLFMLHYGLDQWSPNCGPLSGPWGTFPPTDTNNEAPFPPIDTDDVAPFPPIDADDGALIPPLTPTMGH